MGWGDVAAGVATGGLSYFGQREANRTNTQIARDATEASDRMAREQMAFQERMSNTAHQREVEDLRKAGINPILSRNAGASSPAGAAGTAATAHVENALGAGITGAKEGLQTKKGLEIQNEQLGLMDAQKKAAQATTAKTNMDTYKTGVETELIKKTAPGVIATSDMDAAQAGHYLGNRDYYNSVKMIGEGLGAANSAKGVLLNWGPSLKNQTPNTITKPGREFPKLKAKEAIVNTETGQIMKEGSKWKIKSR